LTGTRVQTGMRTETAPGRSDRRLLLFVLLNILLANVTFKLIAHFVFHTGVEEMRDRKTMVVYKLQSWDDRIQADRDLSQMAPTAQGRTDTRL
jgi:hypothetical protein